MIVPGLAVAICFSRMMKAKAYLGRHGGCWVGEGHGLFRCPGDEGNFSSEAKTLRPIPSRQWELSEMKGRTESWLMPLCGGIQPGFAQQEQSVKPET